MAREPLLKISYRDPKDGWEGMIVIDSLVGGVCGGGLRVTRTVSLEETASLARAMTLKNRVMGLPLGGGKSAVRYDPSSLDLEEALVRFFTHVKPICESMYGFGTDLNTTPDLCDRVAERVGLKSRLAPLAESSDYGYEGVDRCRQILRRRVGPFEVNNARTAIGVAGAVETAARIYELPRPLRIAVQGFGSVGMGTVYYLTQRGHSIVGVADAGGYYRSPDGLDFEMLSRAREGRVIDAAKVDPKVRAGEPSEVLKEECDVLVLAAIPHAVIGSDVGSLRCKMIVEGGNVAIEPSALPAIHARGIPVVPDFIASGGGIAFISGVVQLGWGPDPQEILDTIEERVSSATEQAARKARESSITIRDAGMIFLSSEDEDSGRRSTLTEI